MRLYKRGDVWHCEYYDARGERVRRSTRCTDKKAAETRARQWERDAADPDHAAAREATVSAAIARHLEVFGGAVEAGRRSPRTLDSYRKKAGHLIRVFEHTGDLVYRPMLLADLTAPDVDRYIARRRDESASDHTIHKELVVLRAALLAAKRAGLWRGDIDALMPKFTPGYKPRTRFLTRGELDRLLHALPSARAAVVAFIVATSAEWAAVGGARREDVSSDRKAVELRGTKNAARRRTVPIVSDDQRRLLDFALQHAAGERGALFGRWTNARRDLHLACERAGIAPCSPHDLRRTFATWMIRAGVAPHLIAKMMGHRTSKMVEIVYAQLRPEDLAVQVTSALTRAA